MPSLVALAEEILAQARRLEEKLEQNNIPHTSFEHDTLDSLPDDAQKLRRDLLDTTHDMRQLVRGARLSGYDMALAWSDQVIMRIIWRYKLASAVPVDGCATYEEIAATTGLDTSLVIRTIRAAMGLNIFDESEPGVIRHTALSRLLATNRGFTDIVGLQVEDVGPASAKLIESWEKNGHDAREPEKTPFGLNNDGQSVFTALAAEPERGRRFNSALKYSSEDKDIFNCVGIAEVYDWSKIDKSGARLIDLGGGYGHMSQDVAKHTRNLSFIVQDLPHVVEQGRKELPPEFHGRIAFEVQNFLEPQEPRENQPDTYLISRCLHDWSDDHCAQILRGLIPALRKQSRLLIWEVVLDDQPVKKLSARFNLIQDFIMATLFNGKERSAEEFRQLLELSDERFKIESIKQLEDCKLSLIEVSWDG